MYQTVIDFGKVPRYAFVVCLLILLGLLLLRPAVFVRPQKHSHAHYEHHTKPISDARGKLNSLKKILNCNDRHLKRQTIQFDRYWLLLNFVQGTKSAKVGCADTITYTTIADYRFLQNLTTLVTRWHAPISVAVYAPGSDMNATLSNIQHLRSCVPESELIQKFVTFHIFFPTEHMPDYVPLTEHEALQWKCECRSKPLTSCNKDLYRRDEGLAFPINVARNIARKAANTHFILSADIELMPSLGLVHKFLYLINQKWTIRINNKFPMVFPLALFEVVPNATLPQTKTELLELLSTNQAKSFHDHNDDRHKIPHYQQWLTSNENNDLTILGVSRRHGKYRSWEPVYISDNTEPMYDERFNYEDNYDKRLQAYAMCLLEYEYYVLRDAFLVHKPSIKIEDKNPKNKFSNDMKNIIKNKIKPEYIKMFGANKKCDV